MTGAVYTEDKLEYTFFPINKFTVNLSVKAPHNAHICLATEASSEANPMIEIFIGGWENGKSAIRLNREKPDKAEAVTPFICSADEDKNFVLSWTNDGEISISMAGASEPFLFWKNEEPFPINQLGVRTAHGATGTWKIGGKELSTEDSKEYTFLPVFEGSLNFEVRAQHNAHIALTGSEADAPPLYEIFLGGWENSKCAIRLNKEKPDKALAETEACLSGGEYRKFWIKWNYGTIQVGRDGESDPVMEVPNPDPITVRYFGIRTGYGADGYWHINGVEGTAAEPEAPTEPAAEEAPPAETAENEVEPAAPEETPAPAEDAPAAEKVEVPTIEGVTWTAAADGTLPDGALKGGDDNGNDLYVARAEHEGATIPGKLLADHGVCYIPWGGEEHGKTSYEVLVVPEDQVSWVATSGETIPSNAIPGGVSLEGETLYVGRAPHEGTTTIGKVHPSHAVCYISYGGAEHSYSEYEILVKND